MYISHLHIFHVGLIFAMLCLGVVLTWSTVSFSTQSANKQLPLQNLPTTLAQDDEYDSDDFYVPEEISVAQRFSSLPTSIASRSMPIEPSFLTPHDRQSNTPPTSRHTSHVDLSQGQLSASLASASSAAGTSMARTSLSHSNGNVVFTSFIIHCINE